MKCVLIVVLSLCFTIVISHSFMDIRAKRMYNPLKEDSDVYVIEFDRDRSGGLNKEEMSESIELFEFDLDKSAKEYTDTLFSKYDQDGNNEITQQEMDEAFKDKLFV